MPTIAVLRGTDLTSSTAYPYSITIGWSEVAVANAELESIEFEENGDDDPGYARMRLWDATNSLTIAEQQVVRVHDNTLGTQVFLGTVIRYSVDARAVGRYIDVEAVSASAMLDELLVPSEARNIESDRARVSYLWGKYAKYPLDPYQGNVAETNAVTSGDLMAGMTLRAALAQTASLAGSNTRYFVNSLGQLVWRSGNGASTAPYAINVAVAPGGGAIAPQDLKVERDGTLKNRVYLRGANSAGSGWFSDSASVDQYGPREEYIDAPSSDTAAKAQTIAQLQLGKVAQPNIRASFSTDDPNSGWRADQNVTVTSAADDLSAEVLRIVKVTTTFWRGDGKRHYVIEAGKTGARLSGIPAAQTFVPASVGQPAFQLRGLMQVVDEVGNLAATLSARDINDRLTFANEHGDGGTFIDMPSDGSIGIQTVSGSTGESFPLRRFVIGGPLAFVKGGRTLTAATDSIDPKVGDGLNSVGQVVVVLNPQSNLTLTSAPTVEDPPVTSTEATLLVLVGGTSGFTTTFQDEGTLANSALHLSATTRTLGTRDVLILMYVPNLEWVEVSYTNVL